MNCEDNKKYYEKTNFLHEDKMLIMANIYGLL